MNPSNLPSNAEGGNGTAPRAIPTEYRVEGGNSYSDDIGFVAYIRAGSRKEAMKKLREVSVAGDYNALTIHLNGMEICVYINVAKLTAEEIT